jgi:hypothetical protein
MPSSYPAGINRVLFGVVQRAKNAEGVETCQIPQALPDPPTFEKAPAEISYIVELDPGKVVSASTELITPSGQGTIDGVNCIAFGTVAGQFGQTQLGNTFSRADKQPFRSGSYRLRIQVNGQTAEVPIRVK